ncbi:MAG: hypothetical protein MMC33_006979 [Icmadophila ericetorum]|nr:hypothetical protein [Icmadophila ericetorum]
MDSENDTSQDWRKDIRKFGPDAGEFPRKLTIKRGQVVLASVPSEVPNVLYFSEAKSRHSTEQNSPNAERLNDPEITKPTRILNNTALAKLQRKSSLRFFPRPEKRSRKSALASPQSPPLGAGDYPRKEQVNCLVGEAISESLLKAYDGLSEPFRESLKVTDGLCASSKTTNSRRVSEDQPKIFSPKVETSGSRCVTPSRQAGYKGLASRLDWKQERDICKDITGQQPTVGDKATKAKFDVSAIKFATVKASPYSAFDPRAETEPKLSATKHKPMTTVTVKEIEPPPRPLAQKNVLVFTARATTRARLEDYITSSEDLEVDMIFPQIQDKIFNRPRLGSLDCISIHKSTSTTSPVSSAENRQTPQFPPRTDSRYRQTPQVAESKDRGYRHIRSSSLDSAISRVPSMDRLRFNHSEASRRSVRTSSGSTGGSIIQQVSSDDVLRPPARTTSRIGGPRSSRSPSNLATATTTVTKRRTPQPLELSSKRKKQALSSSRSTGTRIYDPEYLKTKALPPPPPIIQSAGF